VISKEKSRCWISLQKASGCPMNRLHLEQCKMNDCRFLGAPNWNAQHWKKSNHVRFSLYTSFPEHAYFRTCVVHVW
jgi:hypothetical protein